MVCARRGNFRNDGKGLTAGDGNRSHIVIPNSANAPLHDFLLPVGQELDVRFGRTVDAADVMVAGRALVLGEITFSSLLCHFNAENRAAMTAGLLEDRPGNEIDRPIRIFDYQV